MKKRVADLILELLVEHDISNCFCVVGGGSMHLNNALGKNSNINVIFNHHEQASAIAAEAYARVEGKMSCVCVTSGPGATNALTGVMGAYVDSLPMIVLSGQVRTDVSVPATGLPLRCRGVQEFDIVNTVTTMTKYAKRITDPRTIKYEVMKALFIARSGRRGPVWLDIPLDIQMAVVEEADLIEYIPSENSSVPKDQIKKVLKELINAKRPLIIAGNGIANSGNLKRFREFAKKLDIPVVGAALAADALYRDCPNYYGISGYIGPRAGNFVLQNSDYILSLGTCMGVKTTGYDQKGFAPYAKVVMVDIDEYEVKKPGVPVSEFIHCDLKDFFCYTDTLDLNHINNPNWISFCNDVKSRFSPFEAADNLDGKDRVCSYYFWQEYEKFEKKDSLTVLGNNTAISSKLQIGIKQEQQRVFANNNCGSMGYDLPAAIGVAVATGKDTICVTGDGSIMMNLQELQTIKHYHLPIKVIVFVNDGYNAIRQTSKNFFDGFYVGCDSNSGVSFPSFKSVAEAFQYKHKLCHCNDNVDESITWLLNEKEHAILEIEQRLDDPITPKVMSRIDENGEFQTPAIQDMYPFLDEEEYRFYMPKWVD